MKIKNRSFLYAAAVLLLFALASCGPSGAIPSDLDSVYTLGAYSVSLTCDGAPCTTSVKSTALIKATYKPLTGDATTLSSSNVSAAIDCTNSATAKLTTYPLAVSSEDVVDTSLVVEYAHDKLPGITDCTIKFELVASDAAKGDAIAEGETLEIPITTMCPTNVAVFDNPKLVECWDFALVKLAGAKQGLGIAQSLKAISSTSLVAFTGYDVIKSLGYKIDVDPIMKALIIKAPSTMAGYMLFMYKKFEKKPDIISDFDNTPMVLEKDELNDTYLQYEGSGIAIFDDSRPEFSCSGMFNEYGIALNLNLGDNQVEPKPVNVFSSLGKGPVKGEGEVATTCTSYVDMPGIKLLELTLGISTEACGYDMNDPDQKIEMQNRANGMKFGAVDAVDCTPELGGANKLEISKEWMAWMVRTGENPHTFTEYDENNQPLEFAVVEAPYFGAYAANSGFSAGVVYSSSLKSGALNGGVVTLFVGKAPNLGGGSEPFTLMIKSFESDIAAIGQE